MADTPDTPDVIDEPQRSRFRYSEAGTDAQLVYRAESGRLILVHTEVPDTMAGRGVAGRLVRAAVERAERTGETVVPLCPYARKWLGDHPDVVAGMAVDWTEP